MCRFATINAILVMLTSSILFAQTTIPGGYVSGTWTATGSPYLIQGDITIHTDSTLTIEPDVDVDFQGHYIFIVNGVLQAVGTETDSICFFAADTVIGWKGIVELTLYKRFCQLNGLVTVFLVKNLVIKAGQNLHALVL